MTEEELQFAISQYVDGTLPCEQLPALEARIAADAAARRILDEFRQINNLISGSMPVPEMDWEALSSKISLAIDREQQAPAAIPLPISEPSVRSWWASARVYAIAAGVIVAVTAGILTWKSTTALQSASPPVASAMPNQTLETPAVAASQTIIEICRVDAPAGAPVSEIRISETLAPEVGLADLYPDSTAFDRSSVAIGPMPGRRPMDADALLLH